MSFALGFTKGNRNSVEYNADMLKKEDVEHLTKYWHENPTPEMFHFAISLTKQFTQMDSIAMLCAGLSAIALNHGHPYFRQLSTALFLIGLQKEIPIEKLMPWHVPLDGIHNHVFSTKSLPQHESETNTPNQRKGFVHGHYRFFTAASLANILRARELCDVLVVGLEANWRTLHYKQVKPEVIDWMRFQWLLASGFRGQILKIQRVQYTPEGYSRLVQRIKPQIYFGNEGISTLGLQQMELAAKQSGADFVILPKQPGKSTSELLLERE